MATNSSGIMGSLEDIFGKKAPQLPKGAKDFLVKYAHIFAIIGIVIYALGILALLGIGAVVSPFAAAVGATGFFTGVFFGVVTLGIEAGLLLMAIPGLKKRSMQGWNLLFYSEVVSIVVNVLQINILSAIISFLIGFYILFQIRSYYK